MRRKEGFTLIELMIVVAIIAIIAAIAIPNIIIATMSARETGAMGSLKSLLAVENTWKQSDYDRNGIKDYWTYDVSCLYLMKDASGVVLKTIDLSLAQSDIYFLSAKNNPNISTLIDTTWTITTAQAKSGYFCAAIVNDEVPLAYNQNGVYNLARTATTAACNSDKFGMCTYPQVYGSSGRQTYILNQEGQVWSKDNATAAPIAQWPGVDPKTAGWTAP